MGVQEGNDVVWGSGSITQVHPDDLAVDIPHTAHRINHDSWFQVGLVLTTGINSAYVLGYSGALMVPLGWKAGIVGLIVASAISYYASTLVAELHEFGGMRHIRYRDLAKSLYGGQGYSLTWALQYANFFMINVGYIILAGQALKATYGLLVDYNSLTLPYFIALAGIACSLFAITIPHLSALRLWLPLSTFFSLVYIIVGSALALKDGLKAPPRDYNIPGTSVSRFFTTIFAAANLVFAFNTGMLPEIQATLRPPVVQNMMKSLHFQFTIGNLPMFVVTLIGYWAYGCNASTYLLNNVNGPTWLKAVANISAFLQTIIAFHIFGCPTYEYLDTKYGVGGSPLTSHNLSFRIIARGSYIAIITLVSAMLPFLVDFMSLTGALSTFPLTFILANHMYIAAKGNMLTPLQKNWHWFNVGFFSCLCVAAVVSTVMLIGQHCFTYSLFTDL